MLRQGLVHSLPDICVPTLKSCMMELNSLPELSLTLAKRRIDLWRRAIFLFSKTSKEEGPFHKAGYTDFFCEGKSEEKLCPDIFGVSPKYYSICDISMSPQKGGDMKKYTECKPSSYVKSLFISEWNSAGDPFLITDEFELIKLKGYNLIQVIQPGEATLDQVNDETLRKNLLKWNGFISVPPSFQLLAVPESSPEELKAPIAGILKWASTQESVSLEKVVENLLGHLYTSFSLKSKGELRKKVEDIISDLSKLYLKDYLKYNRSEKTFSVDIDPTNWQSKKAFSDKINQWLEIIPIESFFNDESESIDN